MIKRTGRTKAIAIKAVEGAAVARVKAWHDKEAKAAADAVPTISELAEQWFRTIEPPKVGVSSSGDELPASRGTKIRRQTFDQYQSTYRNHIQEPLGSMRVTEVGTKVCGDFLHGLIEDDAGLTKARLAKVVLKAVLDVAVRHETISYNPVKNVAPLPRKQIQPRSLSAPSLAQVREAVRSWRNEPGTFGPPNDGMLTDIVDVLLGTGVRIGEVLALRWSDVNLEGPVPTVRITGTIVEPRQGPKYRQAKPKSKRGFREIPLPQFAVDTLKRRRMLSPEHNLADAVFWSQEGTYKQPSAVRRSLRSALNAAGVEPGFSVTPHTFRRTVATILKQEVGAEAAQSVLGHTSVAIAEKSYFDIPSLVEDHRQVLESRISTDRISSPAAHRND
ncbi:tyrosine-type recombinase/integrase [Arthrobacter zhaoguopingii]|uniref:tyrosine-type recombinase/integrase n=1 Tax=Arthrobacter zhaoguopingii TaxID=2681491 RepID=UPI001356B76B|nr:site-specific integrase [Arthrobacter zhaoguopingii]